MNGPVKVAQKAAFIPFLSFAAVTRVPSFFWSIITPRNPTAPVTALMNVEANGSMFDMASSPVESFSIRVSEKRPPVEGVAQWSRVTLYH